jgi:hypothetical protein
VKVGATTRIVIDARVVDERDVGVLGDRVSPRRPVSDAVGRMYPSPDRVHERARDVVRAKLKSPPTLADPDEESRLGPICTSSASSWSNRRTTS